MPRFLADESCDFRIVRRLQAAGFDVLAVAENRVLLTEDTDFGRLVYAQVLSLVQRLGDGLIGAFVVVQPGRTRISRSP